MKKRIAISLIVFMLIIHLAACDGHSNSVASSGHSELYSVANVSVPFVTGNYDWEQVEIIEKDSYGRIMFKYRSISTMLSDYCGSYLYALVVCQMYDKDYSYYYDNDSFIYLRENGSASDEDVQRLKSWNDWGKPINQSKMRYVKNSFNDVPKNVAENVKNNISAYLSDNDELKRSYDVISTDNYKRYLYAIREYKENKKKYTFYHSYFAVCDEAYNVLTVNGEPCIIEIKDIVHCQDDMKKIKEMSGWNLPR